MNETFQQFTERMSQVEKKEERQVGAWHSNHSRAIFVFEGQYCYLESVFPSNWFLSSTATWWTDFSVDGVELAERIAKHYGATVEKDWYQEEGGQWHHFCFADSKDEDHGFEKLMRFVFDRHTGEFEKMFGVGKVSA